MQDEKKPPMQGKTTIRDHAPTLKSFTIREQSQRIYMVRMRDTSTTSEPPKERGKRSKENLLSLEAFFLRKNVVLEE